jgi:hypothetical protein
MTLTRMQSQVGGMFGITRQLRRKASYLCTPLREWEIWRNNSFIWFWFFLYRIGHILTRSPHKGYSIILWNWEYNYYKEVATPFEDMMKWKQKFIGGIFVSKCCCKDIMREITISKFEDINLNICRHVVN